jgi:spore germination protein Q
MMPDNKENQQREDRPANSGSGMSTNPYVSPYGSPTQYPAGYGSYQMPGQVMGTQGMTPYQEPYPGVPQQMAGQGMYMQQTPGQQISPQMGQPGEPPADPGQMPLQQSYIENILRLNKGEIATVYQTFENNEEWNAKVFRGRIEAAGRDHIILSDVETNKRYLLLMIYVDYITFEGPIEYSYPAELYQL